MNEGIFTNPLDNDQIESKTTMDLFKKMSCQSSQKLQKMKQQN